MKLFFSHASPFARKARVVAIEKCIEDKMELVATSPLDSPPDLLAANPLSKIPALVLDNGDMLCESPVICEYLDSLRPTPVLFPASGEARWRALNLAALADGVMDAAVGMVLEGRRPEQLRSSMWVERHTAAIHRTIGLLASKLDGLQNLDIAAINTACALGYVNFRHPHIGWQKSNPGLAQWFEAFSDRQSMKETMPKV